MALDRHRKVYIDRYVRTERDETTGRVPNNALEKARNLVVEGYYEDAIAFLNSHQELNLDPEALRARGAAKSHIKDFMGAHQDFDAAELLLLHALSALYCNIAASYLEQNRYDDACPYVEKAMTFDPQWYLPYVNKMSYHALRGEIGLVWETLASLNRQWPAGRYNAKIKSYIFTDGILAIVRAEEEFSERIKNYVDVDLN